MSIIVLRCSCMDIYSPSWSRQLGDHYITLSQWVLRSREYVRVLPSTYPHLGNFNSLQAAESIFFVKHRCFFSNFDPPKQNCLLVSSSDTGGKCHAHHSAGVAAPDAFHHAHATGRWHLAPGCWYDGQRSDGGGGEGTGGSREGNGEGDGGGGQTNFSRRYVSLLKASFKPVCTSLARRD